MKQVLMLSLASQTPDKILQVVVALANNLSSLELCPRKALAPSLQDWCPKSPLPLTKDATFLPWSFTNRLISLNLPVSQQWQLPFPSGQVPQLTTVTSSEHDCPFCIPSCSHGMKWLFFFFINSSHVNSP